MEQRFYNAAIKCAPAPSSLETTPLDWTDPWDHGVFYQCGDQQVTCGACQSGKNGDCSNAPHSYTRLRCCKVNNYDDFDVVGRWQYIRTVAGNVVETETLGTKKTDYRNGARIQMWELVGYPNQKWTVESV